MVVFELELAEIVLETFFDELLFFAFENVGNVELLEPFVGKVDTELLKTVLFEDFEPEDIEKTNVVVALVVDDLLNIDRASAHEFTWNGGEVEPFDQPIEKLVEELFS